MAGSTRTVKRQWSNYSNSSGAPEDAFKVMYEELNNLITDVETLRAHLVDGSDGVLLSAPAVKAGTTDDTTLRNEACTIQIRGSGSISVAAAETAFTATTHDVASAKEAYFVLSVQSDGSSITITKGADADVGSAVKPAAPVNEVILGYVLVAGAFDATTDTLTGTFEDATVMAASGLVAAAMSTVESQD